MINIFYVPGMFGSTVEFCLRTFSVEFSNELPAFKTLSGMTFDGATHGFVKEFHPTTLASIKSQRKHFSISTPIYPMIDADLDTIFTYMNSLGHHDIKNIILCANSYDDAELNVLFQYYKIANGDLNQGLSIFSDTTINSTYNKWGDSYTNWNQLRSWEFREWFSLFYPSWISKWIQPQEICNADTMGVFNQDFLKDPYKCMISIYNFCGLTVNDTGGLKKFTSEWLKCQRYILTEYANIKKFIDCSINDIDFNWPGVYPINIISEAIIQKQLLDRGITLKCYNLTNLPKNSKELRTLFNI